MALEIPSTMPMLGHVLCASPPGSLFCLNLQVEVMAPFNFVSSYGYASLHVLSNARPDNLTFYTAVIVFLSLSEPKSLVL